MLYTIIATVSKVNIKAKTVELKGVGKYQFLGDGNKTFNILCASETTDSKIIESTTGFILQRCTFYQTLLATAMVNQKPLKFGIDEKDSNWTITSISIPNA